MHGILTVLMLAAAAAPPGDDWFLLTSHSPVNDREGLHLAVSPDGLHWQVVNAVAVPDGGAVGVGTWQTQAEFKDIKVTRHGETLAAPALNDTQGWKLLGDGQWQATGGVLRQTSPAANVRAIFGDRTWTDYTLSLKARKLGGAEGFLILFGVGSETAKSWWNLGGWGNTALGLELEHAKAPPRAPGKIETGRWYDIRVEFQGKHIQCYLDGQLIHDTTIVGDRVVERPVFARTVGEVLRDPSIARDEAGTYHLVWTAAWGAGKVKGIGYASSQDLVHWSEQRLLPLMENEPGTEYIWAPELFWDAKERQWMIHWASSVTGKFPETLALYDGRNNARIYYTLTKDFQTFTPSRVLFDAHCLAIDSFVYGADDGQYYVFFKADRREEPKRGLFMAKAPAATGPYTLDPRPITGPDEGWAEGPCALKVGDRVRLYYAAPGPGFSAYETIDLHTWTDLRKSMTPPGGYRHGTVIRIPAAQAQALLDHRFPDWSTPR